jgi:peptidoglycan/LPS O-acetylase OafA/YrhL
VRIWPLHGFVLSGGVALALLLAASGRPDDSQFPFDVLPFHYLLVQNWGLTERVAWNDPAWSISAEMAAYLAFPVIALAIDWRRVPSWAIVATLAALFAVLTAAIGPSLNADIPRNGALRCMVEFGAGTAVCGLWLRFRDRRWAAWRAAGVAMALIGATALGVLPETLAVPAAFAAILLALAIDGERPGMFGTAWLHRLGEISYATYLAHFLMWKAFKLAFLAQPGPVGLPLIGLYLTAVLIASVALYHLVERPAQRWLNALPARIAGGRRARRIA